MDHKNDLPLMSNTRDIAVYHYVLDLSCDFDTRQLHGSITLFLSSKLQNSKDASCSSQIFSIKEYSAVPQKKTSVSGEEFNRNREEESANVAKPNTDNYFELILDCCDLEIAKVEEIVLDEHWSDRIKDILQSHKQFDSTVYKECINSKKEVINFRMDKWCIRIWKNEIKSSEFFPNVIRINYNTLAKGASLRWVHDQESRLVVIS